MKTVMWQVGCVALVALIVVLHFVSGPEDKVVFLDVGQGDAILLQNGTRQILIDGGQGMAVLEQLGKELPWFDRKIDVVVVTHPQRDHFEGLLHVLERYDVGLVLLPRVAHTSQLQEEWLKKIQDLGIPYRFAWSGQNALLGNIDVSVLGPFDSPEARAATKSDLNNASVVTRIDFHNLSFLLTGDAERRVEQLLVDQYGDTGFLDIDILKAGHHGSNSSTHQPLITAASPRTTVISVGAENRFGHPHPAVLGRLAEVPLWRTDQHGNIKFVYTKGNQEGQWLLKPEK